MKWGAYALLRRALARFKLDVVPRDYNSPVPDFARLPPGFWERPAATPGLELDAGSSFDYLERELAPYLREFDPPMEPQPQPAEFFVTNPTYGSVDAEVLYAVIRRHRPAKVIELGSGFSSLVIAQACARNAEAGDEVQYTAYDPMSWLASLDRSAPIVDQSAADIPLSEFEALGLDDVLFADTSHTVKVGSEVNYLVLEVLPRLAPGVLAHFHDVFLPWQYPRDWVQDNQWYWAEQYLLQAMLAFNPRFEILFSSNLAVRTDSGRVWESIPRFQPYQRPGALWLRVTDAAEAVGA